KTQAELDAQKLKQQQEAEERASGQIFSTIGAPVPPEAPHYLGETEAELQATARQKRFMDMVQQRQVPEGTVAPTFAEARQRWLTAIGPEKANTYLAKIAEDQAKGTKEALDISERQFKQALPL